jgi:DNA-binding transcriptional LysR family regulator
MEPVSLAQIQYFVAVADEGHVGRAANALRIAQPAVSRQIRRLEDELGASLFVRTPRGMTLSESGHVFLGHARAILEGVRAAEEAIRREKGADDQDDPDGSGPLRRMADGGSGSQCLLRNELHRGSSRRLR